MHTHIHSHTHTHTHVHTHIHVHIHTHTLTHTHIHTHIHTQHTHIHITHMHTCTHTYTHTHTLTHTHTHTCTQFEYEVTGSAVTVRAGSDIIDSMKAKIVLVGVASNYCGCRPVPVTSFPHNFWSIFCTHPYHSRHLGGQCLRKIVLASAIQYHTMISMAYTESSSSKRYLYYHHSTEQLRRVSPGCCHGIIMSAQHK